MKKFNRIKKEENRLAYVKQMNESLFHVYREYGYMANIEIKQLRKEMKSIQENKFVKVIYYL